MSNKNKLLYLLFIIVFSITCLELAGRFYITQILKKSVNQKFRFNSYRIYEHTPNFREGDGVKDWIAINGQGFRRSTEVTKTKPANTKRVFLMGASAAHGISSGPPYPVVHIYQDETIDYYLETLLKKESPSVNFEVINVAVTGYQVFQHTAYIISELLDYQPDLMIFFDGSNDHFFNNPNYDYFKGNQYQFWKTRLQEPSAKGFFDYAFLWLSRYSAFARGFYSWRLNNDAQQYYFTKEPATKSYKTDRESIMKHKITATKSFQRSIQNNLLLLKENRINSILCMQPLLVLRDSLNSPEKENYLRKYRDDKMYKVLYPSAIDILNGISRKYNVKFIDFNPIYNETRYRGQQLFIDYCHLSAFGNKVIAENLHSIVKELLIQQKQTENN